MSDWYLSDEYVDEQQGWMNYLSAYARWGWGGIVYTRHDAERMWHSLYGEELPDAAWVLIHESTPWRMMQWEMRRVAKTLAESACKQASVALRNTNDGRDS